LIVGGAFVYEFVLPRALEDLRTEQQLAVFGKVRFAFRAVVLGGTLVLILTGVGQIWQLQHPHNQVFELSIRSYWEGDVPTVNNMTLAAWWALAHIVVGMFTLLYALVLTFGHKMPPMSRMRVNFVILLVAVFLADVSRHVRVTTGEQQTADYVHQLKISHQEPPY
ncbi:MAG TPA: hypothetical protein VMD30_01780, partial [Tepidisphaeraceae bacterium]|nr:hypothetical protein [Tepidisphaeraceae bacterium]